MHLAYREILSEARRLPIGEQLKLVEELLRGMRRTAARPVHSKQKRIVPFTQLRGALKPEGIIPSDGELEDVYAKHLMDKRK